MKRKFRILLITIISLCHITLSYAHWDAAYFRNADDGFTNKSNWMKNIKDDTKLSELALPGTHDSATFNANIVKNIALTQTLNFTQQLDYGIRVFDLRIRHTNDRFALHHGPLFLNSMLGQVLNEIDHFLDKHPSETVLIRLKEEGKPDTNNTQTLGQTLEDYLDQSRHYLNASASVTLGKARGKFIILSNNYEFNRYGLNYSSFDIQDNYQLSTNWKLYDKWKNIKSQLNKAYSGNKNRFYVNFLSGSGGVFPYFVASGHSSSATSAPRLATGLTTPGWEHEYPDFPRVDCFIGICTIAFEGTNVLTRNKLAAINFIQTHASTGIINLILTIIGVNTNLNNSNAQRTVGIIMADFPGEALINEIINNTFSYRINKPSLAPVNIKKLNKIINDRGSV